MSFNYGDYECKNTTFSLDLTLSALEELEKQIEFGSLKNINIVPEVSNITIQENIRVIPEIEYKCIFCLNSGESEIIYENEENLMEHIRICPSHPDRSGEGDYICMYCKVNFGKHSYNYNLHIKKCKMNRDKSIKLENERIELEKERMKKKRMKIEEELKRESERLKKEELVLDEQINKYLWQFSNLTNNLIIPTKKQHILKILAEVGNLFAKLPEDIVLAYVRDIYGLK